MKEFNVFETHKLRPEAEFLNTNHHHEIEVFIQPENHDVFLSPLYDIMGDQMSSILTGIIKTAFDNAIGKTCVNAVFCIGRCDYASIGHRFVRFLNIDGDEYNFETGCVITYSDSYCNGCGFTRHVLIQNIKTGVYHTFVISSKGSSIYPSTITTYMNEFPKIYDGSVIIGNIMYDNPMYEELSKETQNNNRKYLYEIDYINNVVTCNDEMVEKVANTFISVFALCLRTCFMKLIETYDGQYDCLRDIIINLTPLQVKNIHQVCNEYHEIKSNNKIFVDEYVSNLPLNALYDIWYCYGLKKRNIESLENCFTGTIGEFCKHYTIKSIVKEVPTIGRVSAEVINSAINNFTCGLMSLGMKDDM